MVSAPDVADSTLGLGTLLDRLEATPAVGPIDLMLAMHRLRPTVPEDAARVAVEVPLAPTLTTPDGTATLSASALLREWLAGGGVRVEVVEEDTEIPGALEILVRPPVPWSVCEAITFSDHLVGPRLTPGHDAFVLPGRPSVALAWGLGVEFSNETHFVEVGGELEPAAWDYLLRALGRGEEVPSYLTLGHSAFVTLVRLQDQGRLDPEVAVAAATARWDSVKPGFTGGAVNWERAFLRGAMCGLWPVAVAVAAAGLERKDRPPDLDALLDVLARHVHEVPDAVLANPGLPPAFGRVAGEPGDDPLRHAVRRLVEAAASVPR